MFEEFKANRMAKKMQKQYDKKERELDAKENAINTMMDISQRRRDQERREADLEWTGKRLDENQIKQEVSKAEKALVVKRDELVKNISYYQREMKFLNSSPNSGLKTSDMKKTATKIKNNYYALALVEQTLDRLGDVVSDHEWHQTIRDLTNGYRTVNAMSHGHDRMNRFAYWFQKAKLELKGNVSLQEMERYFGKSIDKLLDETGIAETTTDGLVADEILAPMSEMDIRNAARGGMYMSVQPTELANAAAEQSAAAPDTGAEPVIDVPVNYSELSDDELRNMLRNMD